MIPRELIGVAEVPGGTPMQLVRHDGEYIIMLDRDELMSSRMNASEIALGTLACERLANPAPRVLVGGYGMGFTLRAVLAAVGAEAQVIVSELIPEIIAWAREPMQALTGDCLDDPRVEIRIGDVAMAITGGSYDAILLDVDNGPDGLTCRANDRLYSAQGLARARAALRPGGVLAIWSAAADVPFARKLHVAGFDVEEVRIRARSNGKGPIHTIWFATDAELGR